MVVPLLENGSTIVDATFLSSRSPVPPANSQVAHLDAEIVAAVDSIATEFNKLADKEMPDQARPATDAGKAMLLHQALRLTLYEASQDQFWHYVAVMKCPRYVAWRWFNMNMNSVPKRQFIGRWYRNALGRLWWWAEHTHNPSAERDAYSRTVRAGQSQEFMRNIIENLLCGNRDLVKNLCDAAFPIEGPSMKDKTHREMVKRINAMLVTTALDALNPSEIDGVVKSVVKEINVEEAARSVPRKKGFLNRLVGRK